MVSIGPCKLMTGDARHLSPRNLGVSGGCNRDLLFCVLLCRWHCEGTTDKTLVMFNVTIYLSTSESGDHKGATCVFTL